MKNIVNKIIDKTQRIARATLYKSNIDSLLYSKNGTNKLIMLYHGVDTTNCTKYNIRFISHTDFASQIKYFKKKFTIVPVNEIFSITKERNNKKYLALTFDDGYKNNYKYAFPILEKEKIPCTFYSTSIIENGHKTLWPDAIDIYSYYLDYFDFEGFHFKKIKTNNKLFNTETNSYLIEFAKKQLFDVRLKIIESMKSITGIDIENNSDFDDYRALMNEDELRQVANSNYIKIGSHAQFHNNLGDINIEEAKKELLNSKLFLERVTGKVVDEIAYPDGSYSRELIDEAEKIGYKYQLACNYLFKEDIYDTRILDRHQTYSDRSAIEQLHQLNLSFKKK